MAIKQSWDTRSPRTDVIAHFGKPPLAVGITTLWDIAALSRVPGCVSRAGAREPRASNSWPPRRDMLGMYVSAHPLDGTTHILSRHRSTTITELTASGRTEGVVTLAGLITHVQRKTTKQGKTWAVVRLIMPKNVMAKNSRAAVGATSSAGRVRCGPGEGGMGRLTVRGGTRGSGRRRRA
ncbi:hypothetical protein ACFZBP_10370 [Streptomyces sp. NPDC008086]|uniref:hypothetical protein n=1 Tax=Streptomyces sp. NPDC008086 TaxID=3364807 RepID=UPI0036E473A3